MRSWGASLGIVASLFLAAVSRAEAQESKVLLTASKPVHTTGSGIVVFMLWNEGTMPVMMGTAPWKIWKGNTQVGSAAPLIRISVPLAPGKSMPWLWDKKDFLGEFVPAGTYRIEAGPMWIGTVPFYRALNIALTRSGTIAGTSPFPLAVGNEWKFTAGPTANSTMKVNSRLREWGWYKVSNLLGLNRWASLSGSDLWVFPASPARPPVTLLFQFHRPLGYTFTDGLNQKWRVGGTDHWVETPAGDFSGCYRLDLRIREMPPLTDYYDNPWFAPGVGLVGYTRVSAQGRQVFRLKKAKIRGTDGQYYVIGQND